MTTNVSQPSSCAGIGCSQHASGQTAATQCTAPDGRAYYTTRSCTVRSNYVGTTSRDWQHDTVQGHPDAVMINRDEALDPSTGRVMQLDAAPLSTPVYQQTRDAGQQVNSDAACQGARADAHMHPHDAKAAKRARATFAVPVAECGIRHHSITAPHNPNAAARPTGRTRGHLSPAAAALSRKAAGLVRDVKK